MAVQIISGDTHRPTVKKIVPEKLLEIICSWLRYQKTLTGRLRIDFNMKRLIKRLVADLYRLLNIDTTEQEIQKLVTEKGFDLRLFISLVGKKERR